jgi:hypothetical protein
VTERRRKQRERRGKEIKKLIAFFVYVSLSLPLSLPLSLSHTLPYTPVGEIV